MQGGIGGHAEYIPEHGPQRDFSSVGSRRYAGYSVQPVSAGGKEVCRKAALNGSGTACFTPSLQMGRCFLYLPEEYLPFGHPAAAGAFIRRLRAGPHPPFGHPAAAGDLIRPSGTFPKGEGSYSCLKKLCGNQLSKKQNEPNQTSLPLWGRWRSEAVTDEVSRRNADVPHYRQANS